MIAAQNRYRPVRAMAARSGDARKGQVQIVQALGASILRSDYREEDQLPIVRR
jgi:hypothetical protein